MTYTKNHLKWSQLSLIFCLVFFPITAQAAPVDTDAKKINSSLGVPQISSTIVKTPFDLKPILPELNVKIPGLQFGSLAVDRNTNRVIVPYLSQYIAAIYKYLLGASIIAAAVMLTYGGFLYIVGNTGAKVTDGKELIKDALIGLGLVMGASTILFTITGNGGMQLQPIYVDIVEKEQLKIIPTNPNEFWRATRNLPPDGGTPSSKIPTDGPPGSQVPDAPSGNTYTDGECTFDLNRLKLPTKFSTYQCGIKLAKKHGINPCWAIVGFNWESKDGLPNSIGYDEVAPNTSQSTIGGKCSNPKDKSASCPPKGNNDHLNLDGTKTDLGLDWRYSRGLGLLQVTIFPKLANNDAVKGQTAYWCDPTGAPSIALPPNNGTCFTARDLLTPTKSIEAGIILLKSKIGAGGGNPYQVWEAWGGKIAHPCPEESSTCKKNDAIYTSRAEEVKKCLENSGSNQALLLTYMQGSTRCRGDAPASTKACQDENRNIAEQNKTLPAEKQQPPYRCNIGCSPSMRYPVSQKELAN